MAIRLFGIYSSQSIARTFFKGYFFGSLLLATVALYGLGSETDISSILSGYFFIVTVSILSLNKRFQTSPFSILFCFFTLLYLTIPAIFVMIKGDSYVFGRGLMSVPFDQKDYVESLPFGFLYLSVLWVAIWLGIIFSKPKQLLVDQELFPRISLKYILLLGCVVFAVTWIDNKKFADVFLGVAEEGISLTAFIFFDRAYLVLAGFVLFSKLNEPRYSATPEKIIFLVHLIFFGFSFLLFMAGSKAAILVVFTLFFLYPLCFFVEYAHSKIQFPTLKNLMILGGLAGPLFFFALIQRTNLVSGIAPNFTTLLTGIAEADVSVILDIIDQIFYRFSWGGLDRFLLIVQSFIIEIPNPDRSIEFVVYLVKNTANLLLPGTPFQEAYAPSSQLFSQVIENSLLNGNVEKVQLLRSLNTQPYTLFGIFIVIFGRLAPIFLFVFVSVFVTIYNKIRNVMIKLLMLYFFSAALSSYGIDSCLGGSANFYVSLFLMCLLLKTLCRFNAESVITLAKRSLTQA